MRIFYLTCLFMFSCLCLQSQTPEAAKNLLDEVSKTISNFENLSFDFTYVLENRQEKIRQENLHFLY